MKHPTSKEIAQGEREGMQLDDLACDIEKILRAEPDLTAQQVLRRVTVSNYPLLNIKVHTIEFCMWLLKW